MHKSNSWSGCKHAKNSIKTKKIEPENKNDNMSARILCDCESLPFFAIRKTHAKTTRVLIRTLNQPSNQGSLERSVRTRLEFSIFLYFKSRLVTDCPKFFFHFLLILAVPISQRVFCLAWTDWLRSVGPWRNLYHDLSLCCFHFFVGYFHR